VVSSTPGTVDKYLPDLPAGRGEALSKLRKLDQLPLDTVRVILTETRGRLAGDAAGNEG